MLREVYTQFSTKDLMEPRGPLKILRGDAVSSTRPLRQKIAAYLNNAVPAQIAAEGCKGRSLLMDTTNIDAVRPSVLHTSRLINGDDRIKCRFGSARWWLIASGGR